MKKKREIIKIHGSPPRRIEYDDSSDSNSNMRASQDSDEAPRRKRRKTKVVRKAYNAPDIAKALADDRQAKHEC